MLSGENFVAKVITFDEGDEETSDIEVVAEITEDTEDSVEICFQNGPETTYLSFRVKDLLAARHRFNASV